jgi:hypothetical protein
MFEKTGRWMRSDNPIPGRLNCLYRSRTKVRSMLIMTGKVSLAYVYCMHRRRWVLVHLLPILTQYEPSPTCQTPSYPLRPAQPGTSSRVRRAHHRSLGPPPPRAHRRGPPHPLLYHLLHLYPSLPFPRPATRLASRRNMANTAAICPCMSRGARRIGMPS